MLARAISPRHVAAALYITIAVMACGTPPAPAPPPPVSVSSASATPVEGAPTPPRIPCGSTSCDAPGFYCCASVEPHCAAQPKAPAEDDHLLPEERRYQACGDQPFAECDDAGDCGQGRICCDTDMWLPDSNRGRVTTCEDKVAGRTACEIAERCSDAKPDCSRPNSTCVEGTCRVTRAAFACGAAPCAAGDTCIEVDKARACVPAAKVPDDAVVIECDRGRDCGADEFCRATPKGTTCDLRRYGAAMEAVICVDASDCRACTKIAPDLQPACAHSADAVDPTGRCRCDPACQQDDDCKDHCQRQGNADGLGPSGLLPTCSDGHCNCTES